MNKVSRISPVEDVGMAPLVFDVLHDDATAPGLEELIEDVVIAISEHMGAIERRFTRGDMDGLRKSASDLAELAEQVGFLLLAGVAEDLVLLTARNDKAALAAVVCRVIRVGDASLAAAIDGELAPIAPNEG